MPGAPAPHAEAHLQAQGHIACRDVLAAPQHHLSLHAVHAALRESGGVVPGGAGRVWVKRAGWTGASECRPHAACGCCVGAAPVRARGGGMRRAHLAAPHVPQLERRHAGARPQRPPGSQLPRPHQARPVASVGARHIARLGRCRAGRPQSLGSGRAGAASAAVPMPSLWLVGAAEGQARRAPARGQPQEHQGQHEWEDLRAWGPGPLAVIDRRGRREGKEEDASIRLVQVGRGGEEAQPQAARQWAGTACSGDSRRPP